MIWTPYIYERNFIKDVGIESRDDPWKIIFDIGTKYLWHLFIIYQLIFDSCKNNPLDCGLSKFCTFKLLHYYRILFRNNWLKKWKIVKICHVLWTPCIRAAPYLPNYVFHQRFVNTPIFRKILVHKFEKISYFW